MENDNHSQTQVDTIQPVDKSSQKESSINPMKATTAPIMPTMLKFAQKDPQVPMPSQESET